jgi:hypothetical protein
MTTNKALPKALIALLLISVPACTSLPFKMSTDDKVKHRCMEITKATNEGVKKLKLISEENKQVIDGSLKEVEPVCKKSGGFTEEDLKTADESLTKINTILKGK